MDGRSALALADGHRPDLLFLDVRLPELSGLEVARQHPPPRRDRLHDRLRPFAVAAFEIGAIDYLVKPFGRERLAPPSSGRSRGSGRRPSSTRGTARADSLASGPLSRLFARHGDRIVPIAVEGIRRIQAQGDYAEVHAAEGVFLIHVTLSELAARLDPARFRQVHRSHIVNLDAVAHMQPYDDRRLAITSEGRQRRRREPRGLRGAAAPRA